MTIKPQTFWVVLTTRTGFEAQRVILGRNLILVCDGAITADDLEGLRGQLPRGLRLDERFPFKDPVIVEAWAA